MRSTCKQHAITISPTAMGSYAALAARCLAPLAERIGLVSASVPMLVLVAPKNHEIPPMGKHRLVFDAFATAKQPEQIAHKRGSGSAASSFPSGGRVLGKASVCFWLEPKWHTLTLPPSYPMIRLIATYACCACFFLAISSHTGHLPP